MPCTMPSAYDMYRTNVCDREFVLRRETWAKERRTSKSAIPSLNKTCNPPARTHQEICKRRWHPCRTHQRWRRASQILDQIFYYADTTKKNLCLALLVTLFRSWVTDSSVTDERSKIQDNVIPDIRREVTRRRSFSDSSCRVVHETCFPCLIICTNTAGFRFPSNSAGSFKWYPRFAA